MWAQGKANDPKQRECMLNQFAKTWDVDVWCGYIEES